MTITEIRERLADQVELMASAEKQLAYELEVTRVFVGPEIVEMFTTDYYHPKSPEFIESFSEVELKSIAWLYGCACNAMKSIQDLRLNSMNEVLKNPEWRTMMRVAKMTHIETGRVSQ